MGYTTCDLGLSRHAWFFPPNYGHIRFWAISGLNHPKTWGFTLQKHVWPPKKWVSTSFIIRVFHTKLEDIQKNTVNRICEKSCLQKASKQKIFFVASGYSENRFRGFFQTSSGRVMKRSQSGLEQTDQKILELVYKLITKFRGNHSNNSASAC